MREFRPFEAIAMTAVIFASVAVCRVVSETAREPNPHINYYPETGIVSEIRNRNLVICDVSTGIQYSFWADGYSVGDVVSLMMDDNDTVSPLDDLVISDRRFGNVGDLTCMK